MTAAKTVQAIAQAQKNSEVAENKSAAKTVKVAEGDKLVRLIRPAYNANGILIPAGIHTLPADQVPKSAIDLSKIDEDEE